MPRLVPQAFKSPSTIKLQPKVMNTRINEMILLDLSGCTNNEIAEKLSYSPARVSLIRTSPLYQERIIQERERLTTQVINKKCEAVVTDNIQTRLKKLAPSAVDTYEDLMFDGKSEIVRKSVADEILDRAGYKAAGEKTSVIVQLTEKMADRFERVMGMEDGHNQPDRESKVIIKKEVSK